MLAGEIGGSPAIHQKKIKKAYGGAPPLFGNPKMPTSLIFRVIYDGEPPAPSRKSEPDVTQKT